MPDGPVSTEISKAPANEPPKDRTNAFLNFAREKIANLFNSNQQAKRENTSDALRLSLTRRELLKLGANIGAAAALASIVPDNRHPQLVPDTLKIESNEKIPFSPKITVIDAAPNYPNDELVDVLIGNKQITPQQEQLVREYVTNYFSHGEKVQQAMESVWVKMGLKSEGVVVKPLQTIFDASSLQFVTDKDGNKGFSLYFDPEKIKTLLKDDPNRVVNMSFQVGNVEFIRHVEKVNEPDEAALGVVSVYENGEEKPPTKFYDVRNFNDTYMISTQDGKRIVTDLLGNELPLISSEEVKRRIEKEKDDQREFNERAAKMKIKGSYTKDTAAQNLPKLFEVATAFPEKLFVVAAGNEGEDFVLELQELEQQGRRSKNLLIVGEYGWGPVNNVYGADIYVPNVLISLKNGSSFSTPVISAYAEKLFSQGLSMDEVITHIKEISESREYARNDNNMAEASVFDPVKAKLITEETKEKIIARY